MGSGPVAAGRLAAVTASLGGATVDGSTGPVILPAALSNPTWSATSTTLGATGVTYTFGFTTTALVEVITSITMTVPPGTSGTPTIGSGTTPTGLLGATVTLASNKLTFSGISLSIGAQTFNIIINGLTNTTTAGTYTSVMTTIGVGGDTGTSNSLTFGIPTLTSQASLSWSASLTGTDLSIVDTNSGDQQFTADDEESVGAGWNITVAATTFTGIAGSFLNSGTFVFNGSLSSVTATGKPSAVCVTTCTLPVNGTTYPVAITTAPSSPTPVRVYSAAAASGLGMITLGGHSAANPIGWWVSIPANARTGSYATTVTIAIASGP